MSIRKIDNLTDEAVRGLVDGYYDYGGVTYRDIFLHENGADVMAALKLLLEEKIRANRLREDVRGRAET